MHWDFNEAVEFLRAESRLVDCGSQSPELIVICQSRPGTVSKSLVEHLRLAVPLAGIVALAGSWCEGETRTGRPLPGVDRLYWYEFPAWWRRQLSLRAAGRCPEWARAAPMHDSEPGRPRPRRTIVIIQTNIRETAEALSDALTRAGFATAWQRGNRPSTVIRGASAAIWIGGQLNDHEAKELRALCLSFTTAQRRVIALLDFPRRDRVDRAMEVGAAAVLGMPWRNADLIGTLDALLRREPIRRAA